MLHVACVKVGSRYGADYVNTLYDMVSRNLQGGFPGRFVCFTDDATGLDPAIHVSTVPEDLSDRGWWAKLYLFSPDAFPEGDRVLYFDLDTAITGPLDLIALCTSNFAILRDAYRPQGLQSSVMAWQAGPMNRLWERWDAAGRPDVEGGDQAWIEHHITDADILQDLYPDRFRSYKRECRTGLPKGTCVVFFHGHPRPHEVTMGWVPAVWKIGGGSGTEFIVRANVDDAALHANVRNALHHPNWLKPGTDDRTAVIVGGGPSLKEHLHYVRGMQMSGAKIFATNNAFRYLKEHGITADAHVMLDARGENLAFVPRETCEKYYASQCHPTVLEAAGADLICWHAALSSYQGLIEREHPGSLCVGGGTTVGMKAMAIAYTLGHRHLRLFGFDSCYRESHHAYPQALNDAEKQLDVHIGGESFRCAPWMITQAEDFKEIAPLMVAAGCVIRVYGEGLIPCIASMMKPLSVDERAQQLLGWLRDVDHPVGAEVGVFAGELSHRLLSREDLTLLMVDSWKAGDGTAGLGDFHAELSQSQQDHYLGVTRSVTEFAGDRARILVNTSLEAAMLIPDGTLDFVFIDADHSYEACRADILAWLPKVKPSGFLSGHDYENPNFPQWGVKRAVEEILGPVEVGANYCWRKAIKDLSHATRTA